MTTSKKELPKKVTPKPRKKKLASNGIPECLWSKLDENAKKFVFNSTQNTAVYYTNNEISILGENLQKIDSIKFSEPADKLKQFATKINNWYKDKKRLAKIPQKLLLALSEEVKENIENNSIDSAVESEKHINKLTNDERSLLLRDPAGKPCRSVQVYYSSITDQEIENFAAAANDYFKELNSKKHKAKTETKKVDLKTKVNGIPKYLWDGFSEETRKHLMNLEDYWKLSDLSVRKNKLTYTSVDIYLRREINIQDECVFDFSSSSKEDYDEYIKKVNVYYANLVAKKEKKTKEEEEETIDLYKEEFVKGIPKYIYNKLSEKTRANLVNNAENKFINKLTYTSSGIILRKNTGLTSSIILNYDTTSKKTIDAFISSVNDYFNESVIPPNQFPFLLWNEFPSDVQDNISSSGSTFRITYLNNKFYFCIGNKLFIQFDPSKIEEKSSYKELAKAITTLVRERIQSTEKITVRNHTLEFKQILLEETETRLSVWDYFNNHPVQFSDFGFYQSVNIGNLKPGRYSSYSSNEPFIEVWRQGELERTQKNHFLFLTEKVEVVDAVTGNKFNIPRFIYDRAKNKQFISFDDYSYNRPSYDKFFSEITEPVYMIHSQKYIDANEYSLMEIRPEDFLAAKKSKTTRFNWWCHSENFPNSDKNPRITHIKFCVDKLNEKITETNIYVNGTFERLKTAFKIKSESIDEFREVLFENPDIDDNPTCFSELLSEDYELNSGSQSLNVKSKSTGNTSEYIRFRELYSLEDIEKAKSIILDFISDIEKSKEKETTKDVVENKADETNQEEKVVVAAPVSSVGAVGSKLSSIAISDSTEAVKRLVSMNITSMVKNLLVELLTEKTSKQNKELLKTKLKDFFNTSSGKAVIQVLVSGILPHVLEHIPEKYREHISSISDELRIQGETEVVMLILDKINVAVSNKIISEFLNKNELVRVDVSNETNKSEGFDLASGQKDFELYEPELSEKSAAVK